MRARTLLAIAVIVVGLGATAAYGVLDAPDGGDLAVEWTSDTARGIGGNHHAPAVARVDGQPFVFAPVSGTEGGGGCGLVALDGSGAIQWEQPVPAANCTIHAVADPTVTDFDTDGSPEVLATTTERIVGAYDPVTGEETFRYELSAYGYTQPVTADLAPADGPEVAVVDVKGKLFVVRANGSTAWSRDLGEQVLAQPAVADFDADGDPELAVGSAAGSSGAVRLLDADGGDEWQQSVSASVTWMTTGQADADDAVEIVAATPGGDVVAFDGRDGSVEWRHAFAELAAVHAFGDGDGDGDPEVYAVANDGDLRAIDAASGVVEWTTTLTTEDVQMTPPPSMGDVDGDGDPELAAVTNDGLVTVVDPASGRRLATYGRDVSIYAHPTLGDVDGDGVAELVVMYGDGRVVALSYAA